jgi:hypothetical protein
MSQIESISDAVVPSPVNSITIDDKEAPVPIANGYLPMRVSPSKNAVCLNVSDRR